MERKDYTGGIYDWLREEYKERAEFVLLGEFKDGEKPRKSFSFGGSPDKLVSLLVDTMDAYPEVYHLLKASIKTLETLYERQEAGEALQ